MVVETSRLREYDVLLRQVRALDVPSGELADKISELRELERNHAIDVMRGRHTRQALRRVRKGLGKLPWKDRAREDGVTLDDVRASFDELVRVVDEGYATVDRADADAVHTLRKRPSASATWASFADLLGPGAAAEGARMKGRPGRARRHLRRPRQRHDGGRVSDRGALGGGAPGPRGSSRPEPGARRRVLPRLRGAPCSGVLQTSQVVSLKKIIPL